VYLNDVGEQIIKSVSFPFRVKIEDVDSIEKKELDSTFNEINELNEGKNEK